MNLDKKREQTKGQKYFVVSQLWDLDSIAINNQNTKGKGALVGETELWLG